MRKIIAACAALLLTACGSSHSDSAKSQGHNSQDVMFLQMMIPHHEQALDMAAMVPAQSASDNVKQLAENINTSQAAEIKQMKGWLKGWGEKTTSDDMSHMGHGDGMMSEADMAKLKTVSGSEFDTMWLTMMIQHHQGAVDMANTELKDGKSAKATKLAQAIIDAQTAEITEMKGWLGQ